MGRESPGFHLLGDCLHIGSVGLESNYQRVHRGWVTEHFGRLDVRGAGGVELAVWVNGHGPALVMVHGSIADHTTFDSFVAVLRDHFTTYAMDRRGFGASTDAVGYTIDRDFADVAAVVDAVARRTSGPVELWGHSYGANCAMGAATLTDRVNHLILYEPSLGLTYPPGSIRRIEEALDRGDNDAAIVGVLRDILEMDDENIDAFRRQPIWPVRLAAAHTIPRECHAEEDWVFTAGQFDAITAPTVLLSGTESVPVVVEATKWAARAIPDAEIRELVGHGHFAHRTDPHMVDTVIREFVAR
jgi:pimeloyl-ACP methyl ester carboxylesterase